MIPLSDVRVPSVLMPAPLILLGLIWWWLSRSRG
jgi:hypothetical protein